MADRRLRIPRPLLLMSGTAIFAALVAPFVPACFTRACEGDYVEFGKNPGEGQLVDADTWQSSPFDGKWIRYPHQRTYRIDVTSTLGARTPTEVRTFIAADETPNTTSNFTEGSGSLVEYSYLFPGTVSIHNDSCADYFIRVEVRAAPVADASPDATAVDAAAAVDADLDAPFD